MAATYREQLKGWLANARLDLSDLAEVIEDEDWLEAIESAGRLLTEAARIRSIVIEIGFDEGERVVELADAIGVSKQRVYQLRATRSAAKGRQGV